MKLRFFYDIMVKMDKMCINFKGKASYVCKNLEKLGQGEGAVLKKAQSGGALFRVLPHSPSAGKPC